MRKLFVIPFSYANMALSGWAIWGEPLLAISFFSIFFHRIFP
jgi:hypothetical protein